MRYEGGGVRYGEKAGGFARAGAGTAEEDMDAMMLAIQDAYWLAKKENRKYVPVKYRAASERDKSDKG